MNLKNYCGQPCKGLLGSFNSRLNFLALLAINIYKVFLSNYVGNGCRFFPSCSEYGNIAFKSYMFPMALWLTFKRVAKCYPGGPSGYDPVPEKGNNKKENN